MTEFLHLTISSNNTPVLIGVLKEYDDQLRNMIGHCVYINPLTCHDKHRQTQECMAERFGVITGTTSKGDSELLIKILDIDDSLPFSPKEVVIISPFAFHHPDNIEIIGRYFNIYE